MGMRITGSMGPTQSATAASWQQNQQNFKVMTTAIQSGNLSAAQTAYSALTAGRTPAANSPLAQLGQAIASGSAATAQQGLQTFQAGRGAGHHHHGGGGPAVASTASPSATLPVDTLTSPPGTSGSLLNTTA
jgi:hypothetical protein